MTVVLLFVAGWLVGAVVVALLFGRWAKGNYPLD